MNASASFSSRPLGLPVHLLTFTRAPTLNSLSHGSAWLRKLQLISISPPYSNRPYLNQHGALIIVHNHTRYHSASLTDLFVRHICHGTSPPECPSLPALAVLTAPIIATADITACHYVPVCARQPFGFWNDFLVKLTSISSTMQTYTRDAEVTKFIVTKLTTELIPRTASSRTLIPTRLLRIDSRTLDDLHFKNFIRPLVC